MKFFFPYFLWAWLLLLIPIIIHLFSFRHYKLVYFSNVNFLQSIKKESKSKSTLKNILILIARLLTIFFLVAAFARPYIPYKTGNSNNEQKVVSLYVDNSFSMENSGVDGSLLDESKLKAIECINSFSMGTKFALITNDFEIIHKRVIDANQAKEWVSSIKPSKVVRNISEITDYHKNVIINTDTTRNHILFLMSDFQKNCSDFSDIIQLEGTSYYAVLFKQNVNSNIILDSLWFDSPGHYLGKQEKLIVSIKNNSENDLIDVPIEFYLNDTLQAKVSFSVSANENVQVSIPYIQNKRGYFRGMVSISDYPITFDNKLFFNYSIDNEIKVLVVKDNRVGYSSLLFESDSLFNLIEVNPKSIQYDKLSEYKVVVFEGITNFTTGMAQSFKEYVNKGGSLVIIPAKDINISEYNKFASIIGISSFSKYIDQKGQLSNFDFNNRIFNGVFKEKIENANLPFYQKYLKFSFANNDVFSIIFTSESGDPLYIHKQLGNGEVYVSALPFDIDITNLVFHPVFIPLFFNAAQQSGGIYGLYNILNTEIMLTVNMHEHNEGEFVLKEFGNNEVIYPANVVQANSTRIFVDYELLNEGNYSLLKNDDFLGYFSFNYNRKESEMAQYTEAELEKVFQESNLSINIIDNASSISSKSIEWSTGKELFRIMLWFALLFILSEALLLRFYNRNLSN